jgi:cell division protein FtsB
MTRYVVEEALAEQLQIIRTLQEENEWLSAENKRLAEEVANLEAALAEWHKLAIAALRSDQGDAQEQE